VGAPGIVAGTAAAEDADASDVPEMFVALTLNVYEVPLVRPVTTQVVSPAVRHVLPSGVETTVYRVITAPLLAGAVHDTVDWVDSSDVAETREGASGAAEGTALLDESEATPVPAAFVAVTVNVYEVPFLRPVTVQLRAPFVVHVFELGEDVTVYPVTDAPPLSAGAVQDTTEETFAVDVADTAVGAPGAVAGTAAADAVEAVEVPDAFVAVTLNVYEVPLVRPVIVHGFDRPHEKAACATLPTNGVTV